MKLQPRTDVTAVLLLTAVTFVTRLFFLYRGGMGDPDSMVMAAGMAMGLNSDSSFAETLLYGRQAQPGMYLVTHVVYPLFFDTPAHMIGFLNWFNLIVSSLLVWPLYALFRRTMTPAGTIGAVLLFFFSPMVWESGTYFHPLIPAALLVSLAVLAWSKMNSTRAGIVYFVLTYLAGSAAVLMRASVFLLFPAFIAWAIFANRRKRALLLSSAQILLVLLTYFAVVNKVFDSGAAGGRGLTRYASDFYATYLRPVNGSIVAKQIVWAVLSVGASTSALCVFGVRRLLRPRRGDTAGNQKYEGRSFAIAAAWVLPCTLFWLPSPVPIMRHYFFAAFGIAWFAGYALSRGTTARRACTVAAVAVLVNLGLPEAAYRFYNKTHPATPKEPHGTFFYYHENTKSRITRFTRMQRSVLDAVRENAGRQHERPAGGVFVEANWEGYGFLLYAMASSEYHLSKISETLDRNDVHFHRYRLGGVEVRLVHCLLADVDRKGVVTGRIEEAVEEGFVIFMPAESVGPVYNPSDFAGDVRVY